MEVQPSAARFKRFDDDSVAAVPAASPPNRLAPAGAAELVLAAPKRDAEASTVPELAANRGTCVQPLNGLGVPLAALAPNKLDGSDAPEGPAAGAPNRLVPPLAAAGGPNILEPPLAIAATAISWNGSGFVRLPPRLGGTAKPLRAQISETYP